MNRAKFLLASLAASLGVLCLMTGLNATDKKADPPWEAGRADRPSCPWHSGPSSGTERRGRQPERRAETWRGSSRNPPHRKREDPTWGGTSRAERKRAIVFVNLIYQ